MPSTSDLIASTKRWLQSSGRPEFNKLDAQLGAGDATATLTYALSGISPGAILGIDLEELYVWATPTSTTATVGRGWNGSTDALHADNSIVEVNPLFSGWRVLNEINNELASLSSPAAGLYRIATSSFTMTHANSYNLAADALEVLSVQYQDYGPYDDWPLLRRWDLLTDQDTSVFGSGTALRLFEVPPAGRTVRVVYAASFAPLTGLTDDVATVTGLPPSAVDIPAIGAAARLLSSREARRSQIDAQPEPRQAQDVPPGAARSAAAGLFGLRDRRLKEEAAKLARLYPSHMKRAAV